MREAGVSTTPQTFIDGQRIGGYDALREYFGMGKEGQEGTTYVPVIAIFATSLLMAAALAFATAGTVVTVNTPKWFIAISMSVLAIQKLQDIAGFTNQFVTYDLLSMRFVRYAYCYPFAEVWIGIGMLGNFPALLVSPVAVFIGTEGALSVAKAVYVEKRNLKCACVGGSSNVPLGLVSFDENAIMVLAGVWMWFA